MIIIRAPFAADGHCGVAPQERIQHNTPQIKARGRHIRQRKNLHQATRSTILAHFDRLHSKDAELRIGSLDTQGHVVRQPQNLPGFFWLDNSVIPKFSCTIPDGMEYGIRILDFKQSRELWFKIEVVNRKVFTFAQWSRTRALQWG
jgi:hypothetical protein